MWTSSGSAIPPPLTYYTTGTAAYGQTYIYSNTTVYGPSASNAGGPPYPNGSELTFVDEDEAAGVAALLDENDKLVIQIAELEKEIATLLGLTEE